MHDFRRDAIDFDIHLQGRDAFVGAGDLEIHVAQVILVSHDVGEDGIPFTFLDQAHRDAGHGRQRWHAGIHQCQAGATNGRHGTGTIGFGDLRDHANHVGKLIRIGHDGLHAALGQSPMPHFAPLGRPDHADFTDTVGREVVMEQEGFLVLTLDRVNDLRVSSRAECRNDQCLGLAAREQGRTMGAGQNPRANADGTHG